MTKQEYVCCLFNSIVCLVSLCYIGTRRHAILTLSLVHPRDYLYAADGLDPLECFLMSSHVKKALSKEYFK